MSDKMITLNVRTDKGNMGIRVSLPKGITEQDFTKNFVDTELKDSVLSLAGSNGGATYQIERIIGY